MATITLEALKNSTFVKISTTTTYDYKGLTLYHTNLMLNSGYVSYYYEYAQGIKTGSTDEAEYCVITKASKDGYNYLAIVLKSPQQKIKGQSYESKCSFIDAKSLFEWAFDSLKYTTLVRKNEVVKEIAVENGKDADTIQLIAKDNVNVIVPDGLDMSAVIIETVDEPESLSAPVKKGDSVCTANVIYGDEVVASFELVASQDVELSTFLKVINAIKSFLGSTVVKIIIIVAVLFVIVYVFLIFSNYKKKKKRRLQKQARFEQQENDNLEPPQRR
jgi:D-alanyl-D-alanine carboxypeptidase (penicillin-binding protein 5/6)